MLRQVQPHMPGDVTSDFTRRLAALRNEMESLVLDYGAAESFSEQKRTLSALRACMNCILGPEARGTTWMHVASARRNIAQGWRRRALKAEPELSRLRGEVERLTRERDEARDSRDEWQRTADAFASDIVGNLDEIAALRKQLRDAVESGIWKEDAENYTVSKEAFEAMERTVAAAPDSVGTFTDENP